MSEMPLSIPAMLRWCAAERGEDIAITALDGTEWRHLRYLEWEERAARAAGALVARGVRRGARVVVPCADDWLGFAVAYLAVQRTGGTVVPVSVRMGEAHLARVAERSRAVGIVSDFAPPGFLGWHLSLTDLESEAAAPAPLLSNDPDDVAEIIYTSGTTGTPKGIAATHRNLLWPLRPAWDNARHDTPTAAVMHALPAGSNAGQTLFLQSLSPAPHRMITLPFTAGSFLAAVEACRPSEVVLVPVHAISIARAGKRGGYDLSSVRLVRNTSAAISPTTLSALAGIFPAAAVTNMYTSTEAWPARVRITFNPDRPRSVGRAGHDTQLRIMDGTVRQPADRVGDVEIRVKDAPARWYDGDPEATTAVFKADGWVRTGDRGYLDPDGYLYLVGRESEIINSGGDNVSPIEIDAVLEEHQSVIEAATYGVPHPSLGAYIACAVRVRDKEVGADELHDWCASRLGPVKAPKRIHLVAEFPRTATGKVIKSELAKMMGDSTVQPGKQELVDDISRIWAAALDADAEISEESDFLDLGGTSLEATEVTARVRELTGRRVRERDLYEAKNLGEYADRVLRADALTADDRERARLSRVERAHGD